MNYDKLPQYELISTENLEDIASKGYLLRHKKTGARIMLIENEDDNKVFNIVFRTPPANSTGVAHITEHTVLCGSRKFPSKDPFVELVKGSLNTFLNAMTYPDKTMYPVASCNDKDFRNLMDVYLDAVFYPNTYKNELIFRQEGWHLEMENPEDELVLNGVVYNEMKGAFSSPDDVLGRKIMNSLFPDTTYSVESGGDPEKIPDLTYEEFLNFHRKFYHPSNSYIFLYGKMDFEERLNFLDSEYLSHFDKRDVDSEIALQKPFAAEVTAAEPYPVGESDPLEDNTYLSWNRVIGESTDTKLANAFAVLSYVLLETPGAPLKMALLDSGIGKDVYGSYDSSTRQPVFSVIAKNANADEQGQFEKIINEKLSEIVRDGIDPKALEAAVNSMEFRFREADYGGFPKGLFYSIDVFDSWLYDEKDPFRYLRQIDDYAFLREKIGTDFYTELIRRYLLDNAHGSVVVLTPSRGMAAQMEEETRKKLAAQKATLSEKEIQDIIKETKALRAFQETPSTQEELQKIPMLTRKDLGTEVKPFSNIVSGRVVSHDFQTNGIAYITISFDLSPLTQEDFPYLGLLRAALGEVDTEHYSYSDLSNEINRRTGGISTSIGLYPGQERDLSLKGALEVQIATLPEEIPFAFDITKEMLFTSKLDDKKRLKEILQKQKSRVYMRLNSAGHVTALTRAMSYFDEGKYVEDATGGIGYYEKIAYLDEHFETEADRLIADLQGILGKILRADGLLVSYTGDQKHLPQIRSLTDSLFDSCAGADTAEREPAAENVLRPIIGLKLSKKNEGFETPSKVQYDALAGNFAKNGGKFTGAFRVLKVIMSYDYLWTNIRVVGGAYGCGAVFSRTGNAAFFTYRDPHLKESIEIFRKVPEYLRSFTVDERDMTKYVIGTVSDMDTPMTPRVEGTRSMSALLSGLTLDTLKRERNEVLTCTEEDIRDLADRVEDALSDDSLCVIGGEDKVASEKELFDSVRAL